MWKDKIKKAWNDNPLQVIMIGSLAATAAAKVIDTMAAAQSRHAYSRQIDYKIRTGR